MRMNQLATRLLVSDFTALRRRPPVEKDDGVDFSMGDDGESDDERDDGEERASERKRRGGKDLCFNLFKGRKWQEP